MFTVNFKYWTQQFYNFKWARLTHKLLTITPKNPISLYNEVHTYLLSSYLNAQRFSMDLANNMAIILCLVIPMIHLQLWCLLSFLAVLFVCLLFSLFFVVDRLAHFARFTCCCESIICVKTKSTLFLMYLTLIVAQPHFLNNHRITGIGCFVTPVLLVHS